MILKEEVKSGLNQDLFHSLEDVYALSVAMSCAKASDKNFSIRDLALFRIYLAM